MIKPVDVAILADLQRRILEAQAIADKAHAADIAICLERAREAAAAALRALDRSDLILPANPFQLF